MSVVFRTQPREADAVAIGRIVRSSGFFSETEATVAVELLEERLARGEASGYYFLFADGAGSGNVEGAGEALAGYACFGPIACTSGSFDLYWIAVDPSRRGTGLGRALLEGAEALIRGMGGRRVYIETSGRAQYVPTRGFYLRCGYAPEATLADFYALGDPKVIYSRALE